MERSVFRIAALCLGLLLFTGLANCKSLYDTRQDFADSRKRIQKGQGEAEIAIIMRDFNQIPEQLQEEAVENIDAVPGEAGTKTLGVLVNDPRIRDEKVRANIAERIVKRGDPASSEALLVACQERPELVNAKIIEFFGAQQYRPAIPLIQQQLVAGKFVSESMNALIAMQDPTASAVLLGIGGDRKQKTDLRSQALLSVQAAAAENESVRAAVLPVYTNIVANYTEEPTEIVALAMDGLNLYGDAKKNAELFQAIYENSRDESLKAKALVALARARGVSVEQLRKEFESAMVDLDARMELIRRTEVKEKPAVKKEEVVEKPKKIVRKRPGRKSTTKKGYGDDYRQNLGRRLDAAFGGDISGQVQKTVNNALRAYASWSDSNPSTRFVLRSYRKHFGGDDAEQRERLKRGLNYPGSFSVVVRNVIAEYRTDDLRVYAISQFFSGIKRWQASIILDLVKKGKI